MGCGYCIMACPYGGALLPSRSRMLPTSAPSATTASARAGAPPASMPALFGARKIGNLRRPQRPGRPRSS
ncbi:MAG: hypothetical protein MZV70_45260 [Desulfobacterales bacterium]|nr:hypothetical protein [Desulfobacterales bacterium]